MVDKNATAKSLPADITDFYDAIVEKVAALRLNTHRTIANVKKEQEELASQLQQNLARGESLRQADFEKLMGEVIEKRRAREKEVMEMLAQFQQEEQAIAQGLKKLFSDGKQARLRDFKRFIAETSRATETRKEEVEEITQASMAIRKSAEETIARFREEQEEMAKSWKALAEKMQNKRSPKTKPELKDIASLPEMPVTLPLVTTHAAPLQRRAKAKKQEG
ncbi:MAG TPA: hypothetical protein VNE38_08960 [Ktedonobacteraceae bacterium]|nr:hypothetical protein [Ktedonobacteraceae bacterium]